MNEQQLTDIKKNLEVKRESLMERLAKIEKSQKRETPLSADFQEQAVELENAEVVDALDGIETSELKKINQALEMIENGTYGNCGSCGETISEARLKALPYTSICINCAEEA
jgi:RNA polymerase-binding protein DksA